MSVRVAKGYRTVREIRPDATSCTECGKAGKTFYDYEDSSLAVPPAFCNKDCWFGFKLKDQLRQASSVEECPSSKEKSVDRRKPRKRQPPGKKKQAHSLSSKQLHLVAVS